MKKFLFILLAAPFLISCGKKTKSVNTEVWNERHYVDEFKEPIPNDVFYIANFNATFNSDYANGNAVAVVYVDEDKRFDIYCYYPSGRNIRFNHGMCLMIKDMQSGEIVLNYSGDYHEHFNVIDGHLYYSKNIGRKIFDIVVKNEGKYKFLAKSYDDSYGEWITFVVDTKGLKTKLGM